MNQLMTLSNLTVKRGDATVLAGLNGEIRGGEIIVVLGPNGAGKSSLLLALAGLIPAEGTIRLGDSPITAFSRVELMQQIAWQGDLPPTEFGLTVRQRLDLAGADGEGTVASAATAMDIESLLERPLGKLSSGERQRTELAALMLRAAPIWLLDEPTAHLDLKHQIHCIEMLKTQRGKGRAIITVLHDIQQAMAVADSLILIDGKGGVQFGAAQTLFESGRLSKLFDAALIQQGGLLVPDYGGGL